MLKRTLAASALGFLALVLFSGVAAAEVGGHSIGWQEVILIVAFSFFFLAVLSWVILAIKKLAK
jgi:hypothetical protein